MKKLILSVSAIVGFSAAGFAQGTILFDGSNNSNTSPTATTSGLVFINSILDTATDINAELLYSTTGTAGSFAPVVTLLLDSSNKTQGPAVGQTLSAAGDITVWSGGQLQDQSGQAFTLPSPVTSGEAVYFEVEGWTGTGVDSYSAATTKGITTPFTVNVGATGSPVAPGIESMPALNLTAVPEPSTLAMAGVGLASMLIFRRRK